MTSLGGNLESPGGTRTQSTFPAMWSAHMGCMSLSLTLTSGSGFILASTFWMLPVVQSHIASTLPTLKNMSIAFALISLKSLCLKLREK